ncbi:hypothetical protein BXO88_13060 [Oribacterium sp. C9]|nr:hypothetical protein BXO88_13060 [Oribacterium sp. C9]
MCIQGMADTRYTVRPGDDVQNIIDNCNDGETNKVTIYMKPGKYDRFSAKSTIDSTPRFISFIGEGDVTVESNLGYYKAPAAELRLNGIVENITFKATHPKGVINTTDYGAYAVHADYGSMNTLFRNCIFISNQTAAVGMGLTHDSKVHFENCRFENKSDGSFGSCWKLGAVYAHTAVADVNLVGAKLDINSCEFEYPEEAYDDIVLQNLNGSTIDFNMDVNI